MIEHIDTGCKNHCDSLDHNICISILTAPFILSIHKQVCEKERYSLCKDKVHHVWNYTPIQSD